MKGKTTLFLVAFTLFTLLNFANATKADFLAPPSNDNCANATTLNVNSNYLCSNVTAGTVLDATASPESNACPNSGANATNDVWFKFVATSDEHRIQLLNVSGSQTDLYHSVFDGGVSGDCGALTIVICSDPEVSNLTGLTIGNTYFIRVFTNDSGVHDTTFDVCIGTEPTVPANDDSANAEAITSFPFNNGIDATSATNNGGFVDVTGCGGAMNDGVWYTFVGDGDQITVTVVPTAWDAKIGVYTGTSGSFTCVGNANNGISGVAEAVTFASTNGVTYTVNIGDPSGIQDNPEGVFNLDVKSEVVLSVDDLIAKGFSYYPNPVSSELTLSANENIKNVSVYNMIGQQVQKTDAINLTIKLDISRLVSGVYFVKAEIGESIGLFKIIKE